MIKLKVLSVGKCTLEGMVKIEADGSDGKMTVFYPKKKADKKGLKKGNDLYLDKESMCPCCNYYYGYKADFEICPNCGWEYDKVQNEDPEYGGGANEMSLNEAREAYVNGKEIK